MNTNAMVADIHRNVLAGQESASGKNDSVSTTYYLPTAGGLPSPRLKLGQ